MPETLGAASIPGPPVATTGQLGLDDALLLARHYRAVRRAVLRERLTRLRRFQEESGTTTTAGGPGGAA